MSTVFNAEKMERLMWTDQFLLHQFVDTVKKYPYKRALRIVFDTYVLEDSVMERKYSIA